MTYLISQKRSINFASFLRRAGILIRCFGFFGMTYGNYRPAIFGSSIHQLPRMQPWRKRSSLKGENGLVEIIAIATVEEKVAAKVWFPKYPNERVQGWDRGMKLGMSNPLPRAKRVGPSRWRLFEFLPRYRRFQGDAFFIGTRKWAAA